MSMNMKHKNPVLNTADIIYSPLQKYPTAEPVIELGTSLSVGNDFATQESGQKNYLHIKLCKLISIII